MNIKQITQTNIKITLIKVLKIISHYYKIYMMEDKTYIPSSER